MKSIQTEKQYFLGALKAVIFIYLPGKNPIKLVFLGYYKSLESFGNFYGKLSAALVSGNIRLSKSVQLIIVLCLLIFIGAKFADKVEEIAAKIISVTHFVN